MKKHLFLIVAALALAVTVTVQAQTNSAPPQLSPQNVTDINSAISALPPAWQITVAKIIACLGILGMAGRALKGWNNSGLFGAIAGLFAGTNTPKPADSSQISQGAGAKAQSGGVRYPLMLLSLLMLPALLLCGCKSTQVVTFTKGTGLDATIPIGYNGNNIFEMRVRFGQFYTAEAIQPVSTNRVFTPQVAVASGTDGTIIAPGLGGANGSNALISASGTPASVGGGDFFNAVLGAGAESDISNVVSHADAVIQP